MRPALLSTSCALALACVASAHNTRPDLNAFVNRKITSAQSLISHIKSDPEVADRYQRHFAMTRPQLVSYLSGLHRGTLSKGGMYTIYSVPEGGRVKMHVGKLKQGSEVFLNRNNAPILVALCGNPVVLGPVRARRGNPMNREGDTMEARQLPGIPSDLLLGALVDADNLLAVMPDVPEAVVEDVPPDEMRSGTLLFPPGVPFGGLSSLGAIGAGLASLGAVDISLNRGGGSDFVGITPVPEPATVVALGLGAFGFVRRRRRA